MTTMNIEDIRKKRQVPSKYKPNSYRIFCEDIGNQSIPDDTKYSSQAPPIYSDPYIVPAQAIEDRNRPHAGRMAGFIRENAHTLNEPVNRVASRDVKREEEGRWWEWKVNVAEDEDWKSKRRSASMPRSQSNNVILNSAGLNGDGYQTTYQKELGYLSKVNNNIDPPNRHSFNPNTSNAVGIVPINDLNTFTNANEQQRVFLDKMSFEHQYDSRKDSNYPNRGKRQGAFVIEQIEPKPFYGTKVRPDSNKGTSVWDAMHPQDNVVGHLPPKPNMYPRNPSGNPDAQRNQRRDPIGYFEDTKFGGSLGSNINNVNPGPNFNPNLQANTQENRYKPSWSSTNTPQNAPSPQNQFQQQTGYNYPSQPLPYYQPNEQYHESANDLLENAMKYQKPISVANGYQS